MVQMKTILAVYCLLSTFASRLVYSGLPAIRPVPCSNHLTGQSGICTFNWYCTNVAHGVHIGSCVDRFFVGTCCKIPEGTEFNAADSSGDDFSSTTRKSSQMATPTASYHTLATKTQTEKVKKPIPTININHFNVTLNPLDYSGYSATPSSVSPHQSLQPEVQFHSNISTSTNNWDYQTKSTQGIRPKLNDTFLYSLFFANNIPPAVNDNNEEPKSTTVNPMLLTSVLTTIHTQKFEPELSQQTQPPPFGFHNQRLPMTVHPLFDMRRPVTVHPSFDMRRPVTVHPSFDMRRPVTLHPFFDMRKPVVTHETHDQRKPVQLHEKHDQRKPVQLHEEHDQRKPVQLHEQHDLRKPVFPEESHDLRWPVLEEDTHDQRVPVVNYFNWNGHSFNNHDPNHSSFDTVKTAATVHTKPTTSYPPYTKFTTQPTHESPTNSQLGPINGPVYLEQTTTIASNGPPAFGNGVNTINFPNFTLFVRPTSSRPLSSPPALLGPLPTISPESVFRDVSKVCGRPRSGSTARIVGGRKSHYLRWPWMISLRRFDGRSYKHKCGAILLNEYWATTAAHCVDGQLPIDLMLRLGEYNLLRADEMHPHIERRVYVMVLHPHFDHVTYENDLALLRFYEPVRFQANIVPVCLPSVMDDLTGRIAVVTGWGRLSEEGELPASLHEVHMPILSNDECQQMYYEAGYAENIRDVFVCAGISHGGLDACEGDSGGPMVVRGDHGEWVLVGLISWGMGCAAPKQPGVYTRISHFTDWIQGIISH